MQRASVILCAAAALIIAACSPRWYEPPAAILSEGVDYRAEIELGDGAVIELDLYEDLAPVHVNNFVFLAREGFFDGQAFYRIIPGFVARGGDLLGTGTGYTLPDEPINHENRGRLSLDAAGVISMARGREGASSSRFFITYTPQGQLDKYGFTAFGAVVAGMDALHAFDRRDPTVLAPPADPTIAAIRIIEVSAQPSVD